jgi:hypothetical protein
MGFVLSGVSRLWTKYRYNHQQKSEVQNQTLQKDFIQTNPTFKGFHTLKK